MQKHNLLNKILIKMEAIAGEKKNRSRVRTVFFEGQNHRNQKPGFFKKFIWLHWVLVVNCGILVPCPGVQPRPPALGAQSLPLDRQGSAPAPFYFSNTSLLVLIFLTTHRADTQRLTSRKSACPPRAPAPSGPLPPAARRANSGQVGPPRGG